MAKEKSTPAEATMQSKEKDVTPKKVKTKTKVGINTKKKVDNEMAGVLVNLNTPSTSPIKKSALEGKGTSIRKIKTISQASKWTQIHILERKGVQSKGLRNAMVKEIQTLRT